MVLLYIYIYIYVHTYELKYMYMLTYISLYVFVVGESMEISSCPPATAIRDYQNPSSLGKDEISPFMATFTHKGIWER